MKFNLITFLSVSILMITISSINQWSSLPIGNTFVWWGVYMFILVAFIKLKTPYYDTKNNKNIIFLIWYLGWNIISIIHGIFVAENYWEWKNLVGTGMVLLLPLSIYMSTNKDIVQKVTSTWITYALPAFFPFLPTFTLGDAAGRYLVPISFLLLFFPLLDKKWKIITLLFASFVIFGDLSARSNVIKFGVPLILSLLYYFRFFLATKFLEIGRLILMIAPIIFLYLGIAGGFNVSKLMSI